ncbi:hypothetical protein TNCV_702041 [Trichonephila clavipes]|nr:hypothetical protein TNCV_702041 [Trichonephila clavipes]
MQDPIQAPPGTTRQAGFTPADRAARTCWKKKFKFVTRKKIKLGQCSLSNVGLWSGREKKKREIGMARKRAENREGHLGSPEDQFDKGLPKKSQQPVVAELGEPRSAMQDPIQAPPGTTRQAFGLCKPVDIFSSQDMLVRAVTRAPVDYLAA